MVTADKLTAIILMGFVACVVCAANGCGGHSDAMGQRADRVDLANKALKRSLELEQPSLPEIKEMLISHKLADLEKLYADMLAQYQKDVLYESRLAKAYEVFRLSNGFRIEDLDYWVENSGSYVAYAARGFYREHQGFDARGGKYIDETPESNIQEMIALHRQAARDLQQAIDMNPALMAAYSRLVAIAMASEMPFTPLEIFQKAEKIDKRNYYVRSQYMLSLRPRWGGSYDAMSEFAHYAIRYADLNPRLWSLQGEVEADQAELQCLDKNYAAAIELYNAAMRYGEHENWLVTRAYCHLKLGHTAEATADYKRALYYNPTEQRAFSGLAELQSRQASTQP